MQESFLNYRKSRYLWWAVVLCVAAIVAYSLHTPLDPKNGGTWLGYTLGTIGAVLIIWLTLFGMRKRRYSSRLGTVRGWLSAHIYLGGSLLIVGTLHSGFQLGWNVHTLAYFLMLLVIFSGFFGLYLYIAYPNRLTQAKNSKSRQDMFTAAEELGSNAEKLAAKIAPEYLAAVVSGNERTVVGGGALAQLRGLDHSKLVLPGSEMATPVANADQKILLGWLSRQLVKCGEPEISGKIRELITPIRQRQLVLNKLRKEIRLQAWLDIWLYVHVPLTFALLAALTAHIISVFVYW